MPWPNPEHNYLLAALPETVRRRLFPHLESIQMRRGDDLYESGKQLHYVYFPTSAIVALLCEMADGTSTETAMVGKEGILGVTLFMGGGATPGRTIVQFPGHGFALRVRWLKDEFNHAGPLMHLLLHYTQALITQMSQIAVCNRHHSIHQQLCRWLLMSLDRLPSNELAITQELIANMLGVRREGITEAAGHLQDTGLIHYKRGHITILDPPGLEEQACECYRVVRQEFDRLLPYRQQQKKLPAAHGWRPSHSVAVAATRQMSFGH